MLVLNIGIKLHGAHHMTEVKVELDKSRKEELRKARQEGSRVPTLDLRVLSTEAAIDVFYCPKAVQPMCWQLTNFKTVSVAF